MALEMLADGGAEGLHPARESAAPNIPSGPRPSSAGPYGIRSDIPRLVARRARNNLAQEGCQLHQFVLLPMLWKDALRSAPLALTRALRSRYPRDLGVSFAGFAKARLLNRICKGCTPPNSQQV